jgi:hypothetical protein
VNIFSTRAMNDSAPLARPRFLSPHAYFLDNCHCILCPSLTSAGLPRSQVLDHPLPRQLEAV